MLIFAKHIQQTVDLIVAKSPVHNEDQLARLNHYVWVTLMILPLAIGLGLYNSFKHEFIIAGGITFLSFYLLGTLFLIHKTDKTYLFYHPANLILVSLLGYIIYADTEQSRILWAYCYPIGIIFLFGNRLGFIWSFFFLMMVIGLFFFVPEMQTIYHTPFQVRFCISYMMVMTISSWIEYHRSRFQEESTQTHEALCFEQILLKEEIDRRKVLEKELQYLAQTDTLTGLHNRGYFLKEAEKELQRALRYDESICFAILDIDHFKNINDTFGHPAGDAVLQAISHALNHAFRETDLVGRLGGEEFAFLLLHVTQEEAHKKLETLCREMSHLAVTLKNGKSLNFTVSIGLSMLAPHIKRFDELYIQADEKLYEAKDAGRNCVR
ncbi:GGDEF domain-containing protein [Sulfurospirillum sp.]|uniref:GGDEF domain-containing protein n=1 Tax=Sulfurospirillum sp. TaxID=2053622 RepID=UPI002FDDD926